MPKKKRKLWVLVVTSAFWRTVSPVLLALDWSRMLISQSDDGGLDGGCRVDIRWPESFRAIIRGLSGGLVHAFPDAFGHWCRTRKFKKFKFPGQIEKEQRLSSCLKFRNVNNFSSLVEMTSFYISLSSLCPLKFEFHRTVTCHKV